MSAYDIYVVAYKKQYEKKHPGLQQWLENNTLNIEGVYDTVLNGLNEIDIYYVYKKDFDKEFGKDCPVKKHIVKNKANKQLQYKASSDRVFYNFGVNPNGVARDVTDIDYLAQHGMTAGGIEQSCKFLDRRGNPKPVKVIHLVYDTLVLGEVNDEVITGAQRLQGAFDNSMKSTNTSTSGNIELKQYNLTDNTFVFCNEKQIRVEIITSLLQTLDEVTVDYQPFNINLKDVLTIQGGIQKINAEKLKKIASTIFENVKDCANHNCLIYASSVCLTLHDKECPKTPSTILLQNLINIIVEMQQNLTNVTIINYTNSIFNVINKSSLIHKVVNIFPNMGLYVQSVYDFFNQINPYVTKELEIKAGIDYIIKHDIIKSKKSFPPEYMTNSEPQEKVLSHYYTAKQFNIIYRGRMDIFYQFRNTIFDEMWWIKWYLYVPACARRRWKQLSGYGTCWFNAAYNMIYLTPYLRNLAKTNWETLKEENKKNKAFTDFVETLSTTCLKEIGTPLGTKLCAILENIFVNEHKIHGDNDVTKCTADLIKTLDEGGNTLNLKEYIEDGWHDFVAALAFMIYFYKVGEDFLVIDAFINKKYKNNFTTEVLNRQYNNNSSFKYSIISVFDKLMDRNDNPIIKQLIHNIQRRDKLTFSNVNKPKFIVYYIYTIDKYHLHEYIFVEKEKYILLSSCIAFSTQDKNGGESSAHSVCGIICGKTKYIYDSNNILIRCDWTKPEGIDEYKNYRLNKMSKVYNIMNYPISVYIKESELQHFNGEDRICL
jgi:hypothetical protein